MKFPSTVGKELKTNTQENTRNTTIEVGINNNQQRTIQNREYICRG